MIKVILVGNPAVGKTSIIKRLINKSFSEDYKVTLGVDFGFFRTVLKNGKQVKMMLYDIGGQERSNVLVRSFYKGAICAFVVADIHSPSLLNDFGEWKRSIDEKVQFPGTQQPIPCFMLCNKCDVPYIHTDSDLEKIRNELSFQKCFKTSAFSGENLDTAIQELCELATSQLDAQGIRNVGQDIQVFEQPEDEKSNKQKKECC